MLNAVSNQFNKFVEFAQNQYAVGKKTAIATRGAVEVGAGTPLEERTIAKSSGDWIGKFRFQARKDINNAVRDLFKKTIIDMFGGEHNIPDGVKTAMLLKDYGKGKPLTARRIMAVKTAIENLHRDNCFSETNDPQGVLKRRAFDAGYTRLDFGKINTAANLLSQGKGISLEQALNQVITKGSAANRAMNAGSLYMKDAQSFCRGVGRHEHVAIDDARNLEVARQCGSKATTAQLATIAENLSYKYAHALDDAEDMLAAANPPADMPDVFAQMREKLNAVSEKMTQLAHRLSTDDLTDRKETYKQLFNDNTIGDLSTGMPALVKQITDADPKNKALSELAAYLSKQVKELGSAYDVLRDTYKEALVNDIVPEMKAKLATAVATAEKTTGKSVTIPQGILDDLPKFIDDNPFGHSEKIDTFCTYLSQNGDAKLRFSDDQKAEMKTLFDNIFGAGPKADKALASFVKNFETSFFAEAIRSPGAVPQGDDTRAKFVVDHFKANPELAKLFDIGFDLGTEQKATTVKNAIKQGILSDLQRSRSNNKPGEVTSLVLGTMPQTVREYNPGYIKFNGQEIPKAEIGREEPFFMADNNARRDLVEFFETKFDANHKKMRQLVSFTCGMALGLGGTMDHIIRTGEPEGAILGLARDKGLAYNMSIASGRGKNDNYDITIAENGDVTIKRTSYIQNRVNGIFAENGSFMPTLLPNLTSPCFSMVKVTATMTVRNATDAELGDGMPQFDITDVQQEEMEV